MQRRNDLCALANSRRNPLDGFRADISNGEDAPPVGFQRMALVAGIFAGQHEPLSIECDARAASQSVFGSAPMNKNKWRIGRRTFLPVVPRRQRTASSMPLTPRAR